MSAFETSVVLCTCNIILCILRAHINVRVITVGSCQRNASAQGLLAVKVLPTKQPVPPRNAILIVMRF